MPANAAAATNRTVCPPQNRQTSMREETERAQTPSPGAKARPVPGVKTQAFEQQTCVIMLPQVTMRGNCLPGWTPFPRQVQFMGDIPWRLVFRFDPGFIPDYR